MRDLVIYVKLDKEDLFEFIMKQKRSGSRIIRATGYFGMIYVPIMLWAIVFKEFRPPFLAYFVILMFAVIWYYPTGVKKQITKYIDENQTLFQDTKYIFTDHGISTQSEMNSSQVTWGRIILVNETSTQLQVYISPQVAYILPKRSFSNTEETTSLKQLLRLKVDSDKLRLFC